METKELKEMIILGNELVSLNDDNLCSRIILNNDVQNFIERTTLLLENIEYRKGW